MIHLKIVHNLDLHRF